MKKIISLDCTLRDGGYYNNWFFSNELTNNYLKTMKLSKIDIVEIGFRFLNTNNFYGPNAYTKENYLNNLKIPKNLKISIMINGSDLINLKNSSIIKKFFVKKKNSKISLIRFACHFKEIKKILPKLKIFKKLGYKLALNLMQISEQNEKTIIDTLKVISKSNILEVLYFADSTGGLTPDKVEKIVPIFKKYWKKDLGIHAHDNLTLALSNTLTAIKCGVNWVDSTVLGMGRGPGNTKTEFFLQEQKQKKVSIVHIAKFIEDHFQKIYDQYKWGTDLYYYMSGKDGLHPSYTQTMKSENRYTPTQKIQFLKNLSGRNAKSYNKNFFNEANISYSKITNIKPLGKIFKNKSVIVLGNGNSIKENIYYINKFIGIKKPIVICINAEKHIDENKVDYRLACNPLRMNSDLEKYKKFKTKLIIPHNIIEEKEFKKNRVHYYNLRIRNSFNYQQNFCSLPFPLVLLYSIAVLNTCGAKEAFYAGFDGNNEELHQTETINNIINNYNKTKSKTELFTLTKTKYQFTSRPLFKEI